MNLRITDIGKTFSYAGQPPFLFEGVESFEGKVYAFGTGEGTGGTRPGRPTFPHKSYYVIWDLVKGQSLGEAFEEIKLLDFFDFKKFGCNEKYVRDLVEVLDKRYKREN